MNWRRLSPSYRRDLACQEATCHRLIDPIARTALEADDPWLAYEAAMEAGGALLDDMARLPDGGAIYSQWMELSDLFDHPRSLLSPEAAQAALRRGAQDWLDSPPQSGALKQWAERSDYYEGAYPKATS